MPDGLHWERRPELRNPLLVAAFEGWNDAGDAATGAADWLVRNCDPPSPEPFATIDPDVYVDYQSRRPHVEISDGVAIARPLAAARLLRDDLAGTRRRRRARRRAEPEVALVLRRDHRRRP